MRMFRTSLSLLVLVLGFSNLALALDADGCFQTYQTSSLYPVICVSGSNEEGIGGRGARVVLIGPNSTEIAWCGVTTSLSTVGSFAIDKNNFEFHFSPESGMLTIAFSGTASEDGRESGTVQFNEVNSNVTLQYIRLSPELVKRVNPEKAFASQKCKDAQELIF